MPGAPYRIYVAKDELKFSCAHMTVFPDGTKERLHGHNYQVSVTLELADVSFAKLVDFGVVKRVVVALCADWRERTLLATANPHYELIQDTDEELELRLCGRRYVFPREDVLLLPIDNVVVEQLAALVVDRVADALRRELPDAEVGAIEVAVSESRGQGAVCRRELPA